MQEHSDLVTRDLFSEDAKGLRGAGAAQFVRTSEATLQAAPSTPADTQKAPLPNNSPGNAPELPRQAQLDEFASKMKYFADWRGTAMAFGESHTGLFPPSSLKADFGVKAPDLANLGIAAATVEEVWWMIDHLKSGFTYTNESGQSQTVAGIDTSHVNKVMVFDFGGESLLRAHDKAKDVAAQIELMAKDLHGVIASSADVLVTEKIEGPTPQNLISQRAPALNTALAAQAHTHPSVFTYVETPRTAEGLDHTNAHYFKQVMVQGAQTGIHYTDAYYHDFIDPVVYDYFHV